MDIYRDIYRDIDCLISRGCYFRMWSEHNPQGRTALFPLRRRIAAGPAILDDPAVAGTPSLKHAKLAQHASDDAIADTADTGLLFRSSVHLVMAADIEQDDLIVRHPNREDGAVVVGDSVRISS